MPDVYKILPGLVIRRYYCVLRLRSVFNFAKRQVAEFMSGAFFSRGSTNLQEYSAYFKNACNAAWEKAPTGIVTCSTFQLLSKANTDLVIKNQLLAVLSYINRLSSNTPSFMSNIQFDKIRKSLTFVNEHFSENISIKDIIDYIGFSEAHFCILDILIKSHFQTDFIYIIID